MTAATLTKSRRSSRAARAGNPEPTALVVPEMAGSDWEDCHVVNEAGGLTMLSWQDGIMEGWLGRTAGGRWAAPTCALSIPRQNGKTLGLGVPRMNYGMLLLGEEVIYTSHLQKTSTETFESMAQFFEQKALKKYVKDIKTALGREQIILNNGGRVKFLARTRNGGRGQHGDLLVFDEALELDRDQHASFLPAISASKNPQTVYLSTPPTEQSPGHVLRHIRSMALSGESERIAYAEWSVPDIGDPADSERWYAANPSLGILIGEETVRGEAEQLDKVTFARERLGWWSPVDVFEGAIDTSDWDACKNENPSEEGLVCYAVKFSPDGSTGSVAECRKPKDGPLFVRVVASRSLSGGIGWFCEELAARKDRAAQIVIDGQSNAQDLNERLLAAHVSPQALIRPRTGDVIAACSSFANAVKERTVCHYGQPALDVSATRSRKRRIGANGGWGFQSTEEADATMVEACALAYWVAVTTKRKPGRKAVVL